MKFKLTEAAVMAAVIASMVVAGAFLGPSDAASDPETITVYFAFQDDGQFYNLDGTFWANDPVEVSYFDLSEAGLGDYAWSGHDGRITLLHAFVEISAQIYEDGREGFLEHAEVSGGAGSIFITSLWGIDDYNFNYLVNNRFTADLEADPSGGIMATADRAILKDGDCILLAHWSDMSTYTWDYNGFYQGSECVGHIDAATGEDVTLTLGSNVPDMWTNEISTMAVAGQSVGYFISPDNAEQQAWIMSDGWKTGKDGSVTVSFEEPGTYYLAAVFNDGDWTNDPTAANATTPVCRIDVSASGDVEDGDCAGDVNGDGMLDSEDAVYLLYHVFFPADYPVTVDCDFNSDGKVNSEDAVYLLYHVFFPEEYPLPN